MAVTVLDKDARSMICKCLAFPDANFLDLHWPDDTLGFKNGGTMSKPYSVSIV